MANAGADEEYDAAEAAEVAADAKMAEAESGPACPNTGLRRCCTALGRPNTNWQQC